MTQQSINERFTFREIYMYEIPQAIGIEQVCFPPNEACSAQAMKERIACAPELFLVAIENESGLLAGFLNGLATDETTFRDEFFTDANLHNYDGKNISNNVLCFYIYSYKFYSNINNRLYYIRNKLPFYVNYF